MTEQFSVSMCVYGKDDPKWFREAVSSILNQSCIPAEVVLVVDGPVPEELDRVIADCENRKEFKVIRLPENVGHGNARRKGLEHCTYELVALMDADDLSVPDRFKKQLEAFRRDPTLSIVGGNIAEFTGCADNVVGYRLVPQRHEQIVSYMIQRCPLNQVTVMFRKSDVQQSGGYLDWYCEEDYYLWLRMYLAGKRFMNLKDILVNVRIGEDMYQRRGGWKYFVSEARLQVYMLRNRVIGPVTFLMNVLKRLIVQVLLPNRIRGLVFRMFARKRSNGT